jgi:CBS-domain-containing membrane protein
MLKLRSFPVIDDKGALAGILNIGDLLEARNKASLRNRERQRVLRLRWPFRRPDRQEPSIDGLVDRAFDSADRQVKMEEESYSKK